MKITILEVGEVPAPLRPEFGTYPDMFADLFKRVGADLAFETIVTYAGEPAPDLKDVEAILVPGAAAGVYDNLPWMDPLRDFIRRAHGQSKPMFGVCFGHQIIAEALGGTVQKSDKGWGIGRHVYGFKTKPAFAQILPDQIAIAASHQDQVITAPTDAKVMLASDFTPNAGLIYENGTTMSVQPHPEFNKDYAIALAAYRHNNPYTDADVAGVKSSLEDPLSNAEFARATQRFFTSHA